ncbi:RNA polymerase sigma factor [Paucibacter sediminis]|uniref:RNA polymerase sigma factor n=1 Tax=Paucibacter sediminis TaxID=3019553 RepID=A0AA95NQ83_9BURK|nr:RNA polymerase sigma factor [Paucibacter sp. S2-9]WIT14186.1 RNA polymerase sigma factor [Paucibacter sp. S2-9]
MPAKLAIPAISHAQAHPASQADGELARLAAGGDEAAFEALMRRHNRRLFRTARSIVKCDEEAEDALQEAYLRAWSALPGFRAEAQLSTWLVRIVANEALGRLRKRARGAQVIALEGLAMPSDDESAASTTLEALMSDPAAQEQPERLAMRGQMRQLIEARIDQLPALFRTVFVLRAVEEMSVEEVALALQLPAATVRTRFFRARALLREALSQDMDVATGDAFSFDGARCDRIVAAVLSRLAAQASASPAASDP